MPSVNAWPSQVHIPLYRKTYTILKTSGENQGCLRGACKPFRTGRVLCVSCSQCPTCFPLRELLGLHSGVQPWPVLLNLLPFTELFRLLEPVSHSGKISHPAGSSSLNWPQLPWAAGEVSWESSFCGQWCGRQITPAVITGSSREGNGQVGLIVHLSFSDCKTSHFSI